MAFQTQAQTFRMPSASKPHTIAERYIDSLMTTQRKLADTQLPFSQANYARLFLPPTFYKGVSHRIFSFAETDSATLTKLLDDALLNIYLRRPDLVKTTESHLDIIGPTLEVDKL